MEGNTGKDGETLGKRGEPILKICQSGDDTERKSHENKKTIRNSICLRDTMYLNFIIFRCMQCSKQRLIAAFLIADDVWTYDSFLLQGIYILQT